MNLRLFGKGNNVNNSKKYSKQTKCPELQQRHFAEDLYNQSCLSDNFSMQHIKLSVQQLQRKELLECLSIVVGFYSFSNEWLK